MVLGHLPEAGLGAEASRRIRPVRVTLDRYGHPFGDELDAVAERLQLHRESALRTQCGLAPVTPLPTEPTTGR